jgi:hypothetical protein
MTHVFYKTFGRTACFSIALSSVFLAEKLIAGLKNCYAFGTIHVRLSAEMSSWAGTSFVIDGIITLPVVVVITIAIPVNVVVVITVIIGVAATSCTASDGAITLLVPLAPAANTSSKATTKVASGAVTTADDILDDSLAAPGSVIVDGAFIFSGDTPSPTTPFVFLSQAEVCVVDGAASIDGSDDAAAVRCRPETTVAANCSDACPPSDVNEKVERLSLPCT